MVINRNSAGTRNKVHINRVSIVSEYIIMKFYCNILLASDEFL